MDRNRTGAHRRAVCLSAAVVLGSWSSFLPTAFSAEGRPHGVVVEEVAEGSAAARIGIEAGDLLLSWAGVEPDSASDELRSPFDIWEMAIGHTATGEIRIFGERDGEGFSGLALPGGGSLFSLFPATRPILSASELEQYLEAKRLLAAEEVEVGLARWRELARNLQAAGKHEAASWLLSKIARLEIKSGRWEKARQAAEEAAESAEASHHRTAVAILCESLGRAFENQGRLDQAAELYHSALEVRQALSPMSLGVAKGLANLGFISGMRDNWGLAEDYLERAVAMAERLAPGTILVGEHLNNLGVVARHRGDLVKAVEYLRRDLAITEKFRPDSLSLATSFSNLGNVSADSGDLLAARNYFLRTLEIRQRLAPGGYETAISLHHLGALMFESGALAVADEYFHRSLSIFEQLAPESLAMTGTLSGLGAVAVERGDLPAGERYHGSALAIQKRLAPQSLLITHTYNNLGDLALRRGKFSKAEDRFREALAILRNIAPQSQQLATIHNNRGILAEKRGDLTAAEKRHRQALAIQAKIAPGGLGSATSRHHLAGVAFARGDLEAAFEYFHAALVIRERWAPRSLAVSETCYGLATVYRSKHQLEKARGFYRRALDALEAQRGKIGGGGEARASWAAQFADFYRGYLDLLIEQGEFEEAFHVLERYRARELLALLAQRDLVFSSDLPVELEREKRLADVSYDRAYGRWMALTEQSSEEERREVREERERARLHKNEIGAEVRAVAPRLAALQYPQPLDLKATRAALDSGTLLLSFSVGEERSYLFAVGPQGGELRVFPLAVGEESLTREVERFRKVLRQGRFDRRSEKARLYSRRLSEQLLAPASAQIGQAERLLILADGPLHSLPFAALADPGAKGERRFLVEAKPVHRAASATVFAQLKEERRGRREIRLTAFGDPQYPTKGLRAEEVAPRLRGVLRGGFDLAPLPSTRGEVEGLRNLYPQASRIYFGAEATERRAKAVGQETTHLHIASHGILDDRFPLDSSLALSIPTSWQQGEDNGFLQVWEIFEQVRIDADLVTLSACDTGRGKVLGGEGLLGLTWAFQYAGARSVLASLWGVSDTSTSELMKRFYSYIKGGQSKADALRSAQLDILRDPAFSHPFHWAGFELVGDWR